MAIVGRELYAIRKEAAATEHLVGFGGNVRFDYHDEKQLFDDGRSPPDKYGLNRWMGKYAFSHALSIALDSEREPASDDEVRLLPALRRLEGADLTGPGFTDASIEPLGRVETLKWLNLRDTAITGEGLKRLANAEQLTGFNFSSSEPPGDDDPFLGVESMPNVETLSLGYGDVTRERMRAIAGLKTLRSLTIVSPTSVEPGAFEELRDHPSIQKLFAIRNGGGFLTDADLQAIATIDSLVEFYGSAGGEGAAVTDAGVRALAKMPRLKTLTGWFPQATDDAVAALARCESLETLNLRGWNVTEASLDSLRKATRLRRLEFDYEISREAAQRFADARPDCSVTRITEQAYGEEIEPRK